MIEPFQQLGARVAAAWARARHDDRAFPAIASDALADAAPASHVSLDDLFAWFLDPARTIAQPALGPFGQPPLRVYDGHRFRIEALVWMDSTTSIHQHAFAGAFTVLHGASFHSTYRFDEVTRINTRLRLGALTAQRAELLRPNDVRTIAPGPALIHQVTHLEVPTVSLVVRTEGMAEYRPQLRYELPGVAIDPDGIDPTLARRAALLAAMATTRRDAALDVARAWIDGDDLEAIYHLLAPLAPHLTDDELAALEAQLAARHGDAGAVLAEACRHRRRVHVAIQLRGRTRSPALRLLTALLMLRVPRRELAAVMAAMPGGDGQVADHLVELLAAGIWGVDDADVSGDLVRALVRGATPASLADALATDYEPDDLEAQRGALIERAHDLARVPLIDHLFTDTGWTRSCTP